MHPKLASLLSYRDGELEPGRVRRIVQHLEQCTECRLRSELGRWRLDRLTGCQNSSAAGDASGRRAEFLARVRSQRSSQVPFTAPLMALLVGRKAASNLVERSGDNRRWKTPTTTILAATTFHLLLGLVCWCAWQLSGNPRWVEMFFRSAGDLFLFELSAVAFYLNMQVWRGFERNEPLRQGWFLISASSACGVAGSMFSKLLATPAHLLWSSPGPRELHQFGFLLDGPLRMLLLLCGFGCILRAYHRAGIMSVRFGVGGLSLLVCVGTYTLCESFQVTLAFASGKLSTLQDFLKATTDPLLLALLIVVLTLQRSVRNLGSEYVAKPWVAFLGTICLVSVGDMVQWAVSYGYLEYHLASLGWYIWFLAGAGYAVAPALQLEAMGRTADCAGARQACGPPATTRLMGD